jgi:two-component system NtrC family sensor kinase
MGWLGFGAGYSVLYAVIGAYLRPFPEVLPWFRILALLAPPLAGVAILARRRQSWSGYQWVLVPLGALALGLLLAAIAAVAWSADELLFGVAVAIVSILPLALARLAVERTELRLGDAKLRLMGAAVEEANELILIVSSDMIIQHANRAFCDAMGYELAELIDRSPTVVLGDESLSKLQDQRRLNKGETWNGTLMHKRKDGTTFPAACAIVPLTNDHGRVTHFVHMERDITEELRLRGQLIHSERLSAVGQLVSGVAHELNNPLQSILGFTELLIDAEPRPELRRDLEQVRSEAVRAGKIVRNLLAFVRRSSSERTASSVNDIVKTTIALRSYEFATANIRLFESYAEGLLSVIVNPEEIQQVILNLILNAEQAMRATNRGGTLTVTTNGDAGMITIEIRDDGPGVPAALAGRVFEPFFSTKDVGEGTGLGLSIAMGIAEAHGGSLALLPTEKGACFRLSIPDANDAMAVPALVASATRH